jgi:flagellar biosynthetic protein FliO
MSRVALLCFLLAPALAHAATSRGGEGTSMTGAVLQMFASLAVVLGIIYLLYYASNRWFKGLNLGKGRSSLIRVVETRHLAPKRSLCVVEVAGEYLLLANSNEGMRLIKKLEGGEGLDCSGPEKMADNSPEEFLRKLSNTLGKTLTGLHGLMESDPHDNSVTSKGNGGRR